MQVKRLDLYDFQLILDESEFSVFKLQAEVNEVTIESLLELIFDAYYDTLLEIMDDKEI